MKHKIKIERVFVGVDTAIQPYKIKTRYLGELKKTIWNVINLIHNKHQFFNFIYVFNFGP